MNPRVFTDTGSAKGATGGGNADYYATTNGDAIHPTTPGALALARRLAALAAPYLAQPRLPARTEGPLGRSRLSAGPAVHDVVNGILDVEVPMIGEVGREERPK